RLRLNRRGEFGVDISPLLTLADGGPVTVGLSSSRVDPADELLYHKTTSREFYDSEFRKGKKKGLDETLLVNKEGHITEGTFTSLFINYGSGWITPALSCGLLPGIWREKYMAETGASEGYIDLEDLKAAERVVIGNSVRGAIEVDTVLNEDGEVVFKRTRGS
ncbi:MAG: aminotransferase class IV, partial [bacterium]